MGQSASTAGRSYKAAESASKAASSALNNLPSTGAVAVDAQRAAALTKRQVLSLEEEEQFERKDQGLGTLLDQLGGTIHGKQVNIGPHQRLPAPTSAVSSGRLPHSALMELLELQKQAAGGPVDASAIISKYNTDPKLIQQVLSQVCLPDIVTAQGSAGVQAFGEWPDWFQRRAR
eukprot:GHUV01013674.1.p1 GENE.GHUV01013674.1~~GHUV01013674.1.p1  ORF type:complete len:190 (+),score=41.29 GHUV01013674.1:46-570(+)